MPTQLDEDARLKKLDCTGMKTLQMNGSSGFHSAESSLWNDYRTGFNTPLTIEDLANKNENFTVENRQHGHGRNIRHLRCVEEKGKMLWRLTYKKQTHSPPPLVSRSDAKQRPSTRSPNLEENQITYTEPCIISVETAGGKSMKIDDKFFHRLSRQRSVTGKKIQDDGTCYITESTDLQDQSGAFSCRLGVQGEAPSRKVTREEEF
ncbi:unnamed protein product [Strongylus vulgaris]|uniref:Uncharacterized protein n=1 Tax=Strongylus vulgaris TaxID=40348 RepID=A0A3P7K6V8_STRVU|nr:unnamed protein product [Strongylus vulgaris]